ncbi:glutamate receptor ionotropic, kainate 2-like isoform X1 [Procambarus clarkii]|uniref:glutamate receptor ionotropic, kainate 2-like isoform X1 n=1 Tax=Procambarus clarkii TaxID=6728 RepID=UPI0037432D65
MGISWERASAVDMSIPLFHDQQVIAYSRPKLESDLAGFVKPFTPMIWLLIVLTTTLVFITTSVLLLAISAWDSTRVSKGSADTTGRAARSIRDPDGGLLEASTVTGREARQKIHHVMLWTYGVMVAQSLRWASHSHTEKVLGCFWLVTAFIVSTVYTGNLMAMIIIPKVNIPFSNLEEMTEQTKVPYILMGGSVVYETMKAADKSSLFGRTWDRKRAASWTYEEGVRKIMIDGYAIIVDQTTILGILHNSFSKIVSNTIWLQAATCPLWMTREVILSYMLSLSFNKNTSLKARVDPVIQRLREGGLVEYWLRQQLRNSTHCLTPPGSEPIEQRVLQLRDFYGVFSLLGFGIGLSLAAFILEVLLFHLRSQEYPLAHPRAQTIKSVLPCIQAHMPPNRR